MTRTVLPPKRSGKRRADEVNDHHRLGCLIGNCLSDSGFCGAFQTGDCLGDHKIPGVFKLVFC